METSEASRVPHLTNGDPFGEVPGRGPSFAGIPVFLLSETS
jgi:hypothetical protein